MQCTQYHAMLLSAVLFCAHAVPCCACTVLCCACAVLRYIVLSQIVHHFVHSMQCDAWQHLQDDAKSLQPEEKQKADADAEFDINQDRHKGQLALRKLYHESDRVIVVLYTSPTCGPCRTLKPIFSKVVDEYEKQVQFQSSVQHPQCALQSLYCMEFCHSKALHYSFIIVRCFVDCPCSCATRPCKQVVQTCLDV